MYVYRAHKQPPDWPYITFLFCLAYAAFFNCLWKLASKSIDWSLYTLPYGDDPMSGPGTSVKPAVLMKYPELEYLNATALVCSLSEAKTSDGCVRIGCLSKGFTCGPKTSWDKQNDDFVVIHVLNLAIPAYKERDLCRKRCWCLDRGTSTVDQTKAQ
jgi:hypothetical protein